MHNKSSEATAFDYEIIVVGAGISGIGMGIELIKHHMHSFALLESSDQLGGTWRDNTYPGVAVDIPSLSYSFSFEQNPNWSGLFAEGHEILDYVNHCADKYGVRSHIRYNASVEKIVFDTDNNGWDIYLQNGQSLKARYVISATGILNQPVTPDIEGLDSFKGKMMHTARWDHECDVENKRVGIIGTGASSVQIVPSIAPKTQHLHVFQRTPVWISAKLDLKFNQFTRSLFKRVPLVQKAAAYLCEIGIEASTFSLVNFKRWPGLIKKGEDLSRQHHEQAIQDPALREKLTPNYNLGCKRPGISHGYLESFNRPDVSLVTDGIERICEQGIVTEDGVTHELDIIILATGFKTQVKGNNPSYEVHGLNNTELGQFWQDERYQAYKSISVPNFPNFFLTFGPYCGGFNWFTMLEAHVKHIVRCLEKAQKKDANYIEVKQHAHDQYFKFMQKRSADTLFFNATCSTARSYYFDANNDASLPSPIPPLRRWLTIGWGSLKGYHFESKSSKLTLSRPHLEKASA